MTPNVSPALAFLAGSTAKVSATVGGSDVKAVFGGLLARVSQDQPTPQTLPIDLGEVNETLNDIVAKLAAIDLSGDAPDVSFDQLQGLVAGDLPVEEGPSAVAPETSDALVDLVAVLREIQTLLTAEAPVLLAALGVAAGTDTEFDLSQLVQPVFADAGITAGSQTVPTQELAKLRDLLAKIDGPDAVTSHKSPMSSLGTTQFSAQMTTAPALANSLNSQVQESPVSNTADAPETYTLKSVQTALIEVVKLVQKQLPSATDSRLPILVGQLVNDQPLVQKLPTTTPVAEIATTSALSLVGDTDGIFVPEAPEPTTPLVQKLAQALVKSSVEQLVQQSAGSTGTDVKPEPAFAPLVATAEPDISLTDPQRLAATEARANDPLPPRFNAALMSQVQAVQFEEGTTRVELTPRGLGTVEVEMRTNSDGSLAVVVRADNPAVLSSLRQEAELLANVISASDGSSIEFQDFDQSQDQSDESGGDDSTFTAGDVETTNSESDTTHIDQIGGGALDLMT